MTQPTSAPAAVQTVCLCSVPPAGTPYSLKRAAVTPEDQLSQYQPSRRPLHHHSLAFRRHSIQPTHPLQALQHAQRTRHALMQSMSALAAARPVCLWAVAAAGTQYTRLHDAATQVCSGFNTFSFFIALFWCAGGASPAVAVPTPPSLPVFTPPAFTPPASSGVCAKDPGCFDTNYVCSGCCSTGLSVSGGSCWDATYTIARCCN